MFELDANFTAEEYAQSVKRSRVIERQNVGATLMTNQ